MPIKFSPNFRISKKIVDCLLRIETIKERVRHLPLTPTVLNSLRETARLHTTHYSTMIEGNQLRPNEIEEILKFEGHFPGRERDEKEIKGYYIALEQVEKWAAADKNINEKIIQTIHALVMSDGRKKVAPSPYRTGQNVIRDARSKTIIYLSPEAKDVKPLMLGMIHWIHKNQDLPCPIIAAIAHYQLATIHPYYDGNGRTARLITTLVLHLGGYDLKGLYSLEEYYARDLGKYYEAISIGESHNYYMGRAESDITSWIEYFLEGMALSFEKVVKWMSDAQKKKSSDHSILIKKLDPKQRKVLQLFYESDVITSRQIGELFGFQPRTCSALCSLWTKDGFLEIADPSNKGRTYKLSEQYIKLIRD